MAVKRKTSPTTGPATGLLDAMKAASDAAATQRASEMFLKKDAAVAAGITGGTTAAAKPVTAAKTAEELYWENETRLANERAATQGRADREDAKSFLNSMLAQYGLGSLTGEVDRLVNEWGTQTGVIAEKIKTTEPYKVRFKGLTAMQARGITDINNEADYIRLESNYRQAFREAGLQSFLGDAGAQAEIDSIARLAGDFSVSVNEVRDRITDAQRVIADTPQEVRDSLQRYYNVDPATLVSYVLDPTKTSSQVNRLANAAIIGGYGTRAGLDISLEGASGMSDLAQGNDLNLDVLQTDLAAARTIRDETKRLAQIEGQDLTDTEAFQAQLKTSTDAEQKVKRLQSSERGRFGGSSGFAKGALSRPTVF